jgi:predicted nucleic acid-binding protein
LVLVDTSVWVAHLRDGHDGLTEVLEAGEVMCHPFVVGELACGNLKNRAAIIALLQHLPSAAVVRRLMAKGLGYVDVHLLASALLGGVPLWTLDKRLDRAAAEIHCEYRA